MIIGIGRSTQNLALSACAVLIPVPDERNTELPELDPEISCSWLLLLAWAWFVHVMLTNLLKGSTYMNILSSE